MASRAVGRDSAPEDQPVKLHDRVGGVSGWGMFREPQGNPDTPNSHAISKRGQTKLPM